MKWIKMWNKKEKKQKTFQYIKMIFFSSNIKHEIPYNIIVFYSFMKLSIVTFMESKDKDDEIF